MQFWYLCSLHYKSLSFHVFVSTCLPPNLEVHLHYCVCEVIYTQSFVYSGFYNRLHTPFMPADVLSSEDILNFLENI